RNNAANQRLRLRGNDSGASKNVTSELPQRWTGAADGSSLVALAGQAYASGLVLGRPITLLSSFHWPRFLRSSTRSKRFTTLRLAAIVLDPFKLRCCDIKMLRCGKEAGTLIADLNFSNRRSEAFFISSIKITQDRDREPLAIHVPIQGDCQRNCPLSQSWRKVFERVIDVDPDTHDSQMRAFPAGAHLDENARNFAGMNLYVVRQFNRGFE